jgi:pseudouridine-5'-monophosphatase
MDGLLINTEDLYTICHNLLLSTYNTGPMTWDLKSQLQGRPAIESIKRVLDFFKLSDVDPVEYTKKLHVIQEEQFRLAQPLPGAQKLLLDLKATEKAGNGRKIHIALATSSHEWHYKIKTEHLSELFGVFEPERRILGDDKRIPKGRGKPSPDIYLLALKAINDTLEENEKAIKPEECLVFEDGIPGVEAGRRAGMRVVWVPHPGLAELSKGKESEILAGRGEGGEVDVHQLGEVGDGWGEQLGTLENFPYEKYGISTERDG